MFQLDQASLGLSREYLIKGLDDKLVDAYYKYMVDIAVLYGANKERAAKELKDSLEFEIGLANVSIIYIEVFSETITRKSNSENHLLQVSRTGYRLV